MLNPSERPMEYVVRRPAGDIFVSKQAHASYMLTPFTATHDPRALEPMPVGSEPFEWGPERYNLLIMGNHEHLSHNYEGEISGSWNIGTEDQAPLGIVSARNTYDFYQLQMLSNHMKRVRAENPHLTAGKSDEQIIRELDSQPEADGSPAKPTGIQVKEAIADLLAEEFAYRAAQVVPGAHTVTKQRIAGEKEARTIRSQTRLGIIGAVAFEGIGLGLQSEAPYVLLPALSACAVAWGAATFWRTGKRMAEIREREWFTDGVGSTPGNHTLANVVRSDVLRTFSPSTFNQEARALFDE